MADTAAGIHFGPAWLRDTFVQPGHQDGGPGSNHNPGAANKIPNNLVMAPAKLAEFRYGREEMLALFNLPSAPNVLPTYQQKVCFSKNLWVDTDFYEIEVFQTSFLDYIASIHTKMYF